MKTAFLITFLIFTAPVFSQELNEISPTGAIQGETIQATISGTGTSFNQASNTIWLDRGGQDLIYGANTVVDSDEQLTTDLVISSLQPTGTYTLNVYNPLDGAMHLVNVFTVNEDTTGAHLVSVSPDQAEIGNLMSFTLSGSNTNFMQGSNTVWLQQGSSTLIYANNYEEINDETLDFELELYSGYPTGLYDLHLYSYPDGQMTLENSIELLEDTTPGSITSVSPNEGMQGEEIILTVTGENTNFDISYCNVWLEQSSSTISHDYLSDVESESLHATFSPGYNTETGYYDLKIYTSLDGLMTCEDAFYLLENPNAPEITAFEPESGFQEKTLEFTITGSNTSFAQASNTVWFSQGSSVVYANYINETNNETLTGECTFYTGTNTGWYNVNVWNYQDGQMVLPTGFQLLANTFVTETICEGDFVTIGEQTLYDEGEYEIILEDENGNDSLISLSLQVYPLPDVDLGNDTTITSSIVLNAGAGPYSYEWSSGDTTQTITVDTNWGFETHEISVTVTNVSSGELQCSSSDSINVTIQDTTGIDQIHDIDSINIYPNPVNDILFIDFGRFREDIMIAIYSVDGKPVFEKSFRPTGKNSIEIDLHDANAGVYLVHITSNHTRRQEFIVISK